MANANKNRIDTTFEELKSKNQSAFIPYICAGDPNIEKTLDVLSALDESGADLIEIGVPFSDPLADGSVNQQAADRALKAGTKISHILELIQTYRKKSQTPIVLYTYLNPIVSYGYEAFHRDMSEAGADGILTLDLPPDEILKNKDLTIDSGLHQICLVAPTTPKERSHALVQEAKGFVYYVSRVGVTGASTEFDNSIEKEIQELQSISSTPIAVGFGIDGPEKAGAVAQYADGVVVGSALVKIIANNGTNGNPKDAIIEFAAPIAEAIHQAR